MRTEALRELLPDADFSRSPTDSCRISKLYVFNSLKRFDPD
jgi:hypothetical protein